MAIKLSNLTFTDDEDDIVPPSAVEQILNTEVANTLAADDIIIGIGNDYGFENVSVLSTDNSNGTITGIENLESEFGSSYGIVNSGTLNADEDNDILTGISRDDGIVNSGTVNADEDNDILTGISRDDSFRGYGGFFSRLTIHSIKCLNNGADHFGPDDTYIRYYGSRVWGDYNMSRGQTRSVDYFAKRYVNQGQDFAPWVELFDKDGSWSRDDSMGGFRAGEFTSINTDSGVMMKQVHGSGSTYEVYYSFGVQFEYFSAVPVATPGGGNVLMPFEP